MRQNKIQKGILFGLALGMLLMAPTPSVLADAISPNLNSEGRTYSKEKPIEEFYGTNIGARATEASRLRLEAQRDLQDGHYDAAMRKSGKAVQLDPGDPDTHLLYARAITNIFYQKTSVDEELLAKCIQEWKMIWHHDADHLTQYEARGQAKRLMAIAEALQKQRAEVAKAKAKEQKEKLAEAKKRDKQRAKALAKAEKRKNKKNFVAENTENN